MPQLRTSDPLIRELWPLVPVTDLERSIRHYRDLLGFEVVGTAVAGGEPYWCRLRRGSVSIMLQSADRERADSSQGIALYFICEDVRALFDEFRSKGLDLDPPAEAEYGMTQLRVPDPDGHEIWFETPTGRWSG